MAVNLHIHSIYSTGAHAFPDTIFRAAAALGLTAAVLTEHDTIASWPEAREAARAQGVETCAGVEFFTDIAAIDGNMIHLLAYMFDPDHPAVADLMKQVAAADAAAFERVNAALAKRGIQLNEADLAAQRRKTYPEAEGKDVGGTHWMGVQRQLARNLLRKQGGTAKQSGKFMIGSLPRTPIEKILPAIRAAGGVTIWAHPIGDARATAALEGGGWAGTVDGARNKVVQTDWDNAMRELYERAERLFALGVDGLEAFTRKITPRTTEALVAFCERSGRACSGGGDTHHPNELKNFEVPDEVFANLRAYRDRKFA